MSRKKQRSRLELIAEALKVADLRLRLAVDLGSEQIETALQELIEARKALTAVISNVKKGKYS